MKVSTPAFDEGAAIPARYTCDGTDVSPPLALSDIPEGTVSLVVVMDDPDAPRGTWDHWVAYDLPVALEIGEGAAEAGTPGKNSWGEEGYRGPCPPGGTHRYFFTVYALDSSLGLPAGKDKGDVLDALAGHLLDEASLMGTYSR